MKTKLLSLLAFFSIVLGHAQIGINQPNDLTVCSDTQFGNFNLTTQTPVVLGSLPASEYTVTYHLSAAAAQNDTSPIASPSNFFNSSNPQMIYVRVEQNSNPSIFEVASFSVVLNLPPSVYAQTFEFCDNDNSPSDGIGTVDLEAVSEQLWSSGEVSPIEVELTYYLTASDAQLQANAIGEAFYQTTTANQVIYARATNYDTGCARVVGITLQANDCTGLCQTPTGLSVSNVSGENATFTWTPAGNESEWELLILYAGGPFPLPTMDGIPVGFYPITFTGLECETFDVYVRARCDGGSISDWSQKITFTMTDCAGPGPGVPQNLYSCAQDGLACFDLHQNDQNIQGSLDPWDVEISYYTTQADAENSTNPIADTSFFCINESVGSQTIYARLDDLVSGTPYILPFAIFVSTVNLSDFALDPITACDAEGTGNVAFDLTVAEAQLQTSGVLSYYTSFANAEAEQNAIALPSAYSVSSESGTATIYVREDYGVGCDFVYTMQINAFADCSNPTFCLGANPICNALGVPFANTTGVNEAEAGNDYGCLETTFDPTWFYFSVSGAGNIELLVEQSSEIDFADADLDIDVICYGPFTDPLAACNGLLTDSSIVSCSYTASLSEVISIPNAQPGQYYLIMASNYDGVPGYIRISETAASQGEIDCTGLRLSAFIDANGNGTKETSESAFTLGQFQYERNDNGVAHNITSPSGVYRIYDINASNSYDLSYSINPEYAAYYSISTSSYENASVVEGDGLQDYFFPVTVLQNYNDISVTIVPNEEPRPGFTYDNTIMFANLGSQTVASGTLTFTKDEMLSIVSNSQAGVVNNANGFTYSFTNLLPYEVREITVSMQIPTIPTVNLGDLLTNTASIEPLAGDSSVENNTSVSSQVIVGSYDPNDKMESRGPQILHSTFTQDDYLYYTIRFENTGTASAINITVNDVLDAQLNAESVRMVSSSHNYVLDRVGSQLRWKFENVLLPPSVEGTNIGHGYITFKVKPNPGYAIGDVIPNTAYIYFDYNPAIVTNTFTTTFVSQLEVDEFESAALVAYPNPVSDFVTFSFRNGSEVKSVIVRDISGKAIVETAGGLVDLSHAAAGLYFAEVTTTENVKITRKLIVK